MWWKSEEAQPVKLGGSLVLCGEQLALGSGPPVWLVRLWTVTAPGVRSVSGRAVWMPRKCCWRSLQNHLDTCDGCGIEMGAVGQRVWLTVSKEASGCMRACMAGRAEVHLSAHFWVPVCGRWAQCCCTVGKSLEQI